MSQNIKFILENESDKINEEIGMGGANWSRLKSFDIIELDGDYNIEYLEKIIKTMNVLQAKYLKK